jgi:hypothetical protein
MSGKNYLGWDKIVCFEKGKRAGGKGAGHKAQGSSKLQVSRNK